MLMIRGVGGVTASEESIRNDNTQIKLKHHQDLKDGDGTDEIESFIRQDN